ncbi:MAG: long-chain fatty acid--CoA ligase [Nitrospirae bacterium]|nr:long-chain fatty acid--CoA ligase [Candidatus Manganitrophaceae bacterium]
MNELRDQILDLIDTIGPLSESRFNEAALRLFQRQFELNLPYRRFCLSQEKRPGRVQTWEEIPPLPAMAFKVAAISCRPVEEAARLFQSSGTTGTDKSRHPLFDLEIAAAAIRTHFRRHLLPEGDRIKMAILTPSPDETPHASLSFMMEVIRAAYGTEGSRYYIREGKLDAARLASDLTKGDEPVALLGTSFSFVHFLDFLRDQTLRIRLPEKSRLMDTGGFKGKSREIPRASLDALYQEYLGLPPAWCINEYGMSEMTSQFYDGVAGVDGPRVYIAPPQLRSRLLHPETLRPVAKGDVGLLAHYDLANIDSVAAILTEDLGREGEGGILLLGRAPGATPKGCSITHDDLLGSHKGIGER